MIPRFLALDPSLTCTGWATLNDHHDPVSGTLKAPTRAGKGPGRIAWYAANIRHLATRHTAEFVAIESYAFNAHSRAVTKLAELGGVIRTTLWGAGIPYIEISSSSIKLYATGNGRADKHTMVTAAANDLDYAGTSHDEADALWLHALISDALGTPRIRLDPHDRRTNALPAVIGQLDTLRTRT